MDDASAARTRPVVRNALLQTLLASDEALILPHLECITIAAGAVVHDNSQPYSHAIFPSECVLSLRSILADGISEMAMISRDGLIGLGALSDSRSTEGRVHMQWRAMRVGTAWRFPIALLRRLMETSPAARNAISASYDRIVWEFFVRAQCFRHHHLEAQLSGWLMRYRVLSGSDEMFFTQQELAEVIGVRREGITEALGRLQSIGAVNCGRGRLRILNATVLATRACGCQAVLEERLSASIMTPVATKTPERPAALRKAPA